MTKDGHEAAEFRILQDQAGNFQHNAALTTRRMATVRQAQYVRQPTNEARSFNPQYGEARKVRSVDSQYVHLTNGKKVLLKHAKPAPGPGPQPGAPGEPQSRVTVNQTPRIQVLQGFADDLENMLPLPASQLRTRLPGLFRALQRFTLPLASFFRRFKFKNVDGNIVKADTVPRSLQLGATDRARKPFRFDTRGTLARRRRGPAIAAIAEVPEPAPAPVPTAAEKEIKRVANRFQFFADRAAARASVARSKSSG